jgi:dTDP-4-dehydrorhamnose reductase
MKKVLITGGFGVVGSELRKQMSSTPGYRDSVVSSALIDVTDKKQVARVFASFKPTMVFHLAAKTDVDWCEENKDICYQVNVEGTKNVVLEAKKMKATFIYPSTFYVYNLEDKQENRPYDERFDVPKAEKIKGVYSRSKFLGEREVVKSVIKNYFIVRFGALFGGGVKEQKFVAKVLKMIKRREKAIKMVNDRFVQPSSVSDTVHNLLELAKTSYYGVYNMVGHGSASYYEYAREIIKNLGRTDIEVIPISSLDFEEKAPRAKNLTAVNGNLGELKLDLMRDWRESLKDYLNELKREGLI